MARWDDLHRAIEAKESESAERVWLELIETDSDAVDRFLDASRTLAGKPGGKRQGGILLWMLAEALKEKGADRELIAVLAQLAGMGPDDGAVREGLVEAARRACPDRADLDALLEKSGVVGGSPEALAVQARTLDTYLRLEPGTYVYHPAGWGTGRIVDYLPDRGRCVIDFEGKPGHEMDIDAAASRLERLAKDDIRAVAISEPKRLRKWANEDPVEMIRQVLVRFNGSTNLRHVKDALVPDAVATSRWSAWWKEARKALHLDPRFHVSGARIPVLEYHGAASADFRTQVERVYRGCSTVEARMKATREFLAAAATDEEARATLQEIVQAQAAKATKPSTHLGWDLLLADLGEGNREEILGKHVAVSADPAALLYSLVDDETRGAAARSMITVRENGPEEVYDAILAQDDPVLANAGVDRFAAADKAEFVPRLLDAVDSKPALTPNLWAWYVRGLRRNRWDGRTYEPYALVTRLLKVLDAVEYRTRRKATMRDKKGVSALNDVLAVKSGALVKEAANATDQAGARHLIQVVEQNRGIKARALQKIHTIILRARPDALREEEEVVVEEGEVHVGERLDRIYMTADGLVALKAKRDDIVNEQMPENAKEIARAREFGDLSENAEYHAAREKQALLQAKADQINGELARAVVLTADVISTDTVSVGAQVHLKDSDGKEIAYVLLGPPDADVKRGIINYLTPLGQALMGRKPGDHVQIVVEDEKRDLEVLSIDNALA